MLGERVHEKQTGDSPVCPTCESVALPGSPTQRPRQNRPPIRTLPRPGGSRAARARSGLQQSSAIHAIPRRVASPIPRQRVSPPDHGPLTAHHASAASPAASPWHHSCRWDSDARRIGCLSVSLPVPGGGGHPPLLHPLEGHPSVLPRALCQSAPCSTTSRGLAEYAPCVLKYVTRCGRARRLTW